MSSNLATKLREGTKKSHSMAEGTGFIACFLKGTVEKNSYRKLVTNLYFVYSAMEEEMHKHAHDPLLSNVFFPELDRKAALEEDLAFYYGTDWKQQVAPSTATKGYIARIHQLATEDPALMVAHLYTRYLGDLSGGQILKKIAQNAMNLTDGQGTAFYEFAQIPDEKAFKAMYRQAMDNLDIDETTADRIVDEANAAFTMNMVMFKELEGNLVKAIGIQLFNMLTRKRNRGGSENELATEG
jgi:heme oxygenase (biliverdin-producing, ferredoxin)